MSKQFDLSIMGIGTMVTNNNVFTSELDRFNGIVTDEKLASHLAAITTSDKASDALGVAKAYHAWSVTKEDAKRESYKNETELLSALTGLGKSSISQLRMVGGLFADEKGAFYVPDELKGYTVGQIYEVLSKNKGLVTPADFKKVTDEKGINCTTSTKNIRKAFDTLSDEERAGVNKSKALKAARNKLDNDGITFFITDDNGVECMKVALIDVDESLTPDEFECIKNGYMTVNVKWIKA